MLRLWPLLLLTACASAPPTVVTNSAPSTEVKVAVIVRCVELKDIPPVPKTVMRRNVDIRQQAAAAAADLTALEAHDERLYALLQACASESRHDPS
jgi:hypothetical protein